MTDELTCPCETSALVPDVGIASGLLDLPRQRGRFGDFRRALLAHSRMTASGALDSWPADDEKDLGLLLIEIWAYLLDVLAFYDKQTAQESYLGVARRTASTAALADLIGYVPKPASAASVRGRAARQGGRSGDGGQGRGAAFRRLRRREAAGL